jgi:hypothetical protein
MPLATFERLPLTHNSKFTRSCSSIGTYLFNDSGCALKSTSEVYKTLVLLHMSPSDGSRAGLSESASNLPRLAAEADCLACKMLQTLKRPTPTRNRRMPYSAGLQKHSGG